MYHCQACGHDFLWFKTAGQCPKCERWLSVRCSGCGYIAHANEFIRNGNRCPKCGASVGLGGSAGPMDASTKRILGISLAVLIVFMFLCGLLGSIFDGSDNLTGGVATSTTVQEGISQPKRESPAPQPPSHSPVAPPLAETSATTAVDEQLAPINQTPDNPPGSDIFMAAQRGDFAEVSRIIASDPWSPKSQKADGSTPLHFAVVAGRYDVTQLLLTRGADVNAKTTSGVTPLHSAAYGASTNVVGFLIQWGADVNARANNGSTPLSVAKLRGNQPVVEYLIRANAR